MVISSPPPNFVVVQQPQLSAENAANAMQQPVPMEVCPTSQANMQQSQVSPQAPKCVSMRTPETQRPSWLHKASDGKSGGRQGNPSARRNAFRTSKSEPNSPQDPNLRMIFRGQVPQSPEVDWFSCCCPNLLHFLILLHRCMHVCIMLCDWLATRSATSSAYGFFRTVIALVFFQNTKPGEKEVRRICFMIIIKSSILTIMKQMLVAFFSPGLVLWKTEGCWRNYNLKKSQAFVASVTVLVMRLCY